MTNVQSNIIVIVNGEVIDKWDITDMDHAFLVAEQAVQESDDPAGAKVTFINSVGTIHTGKAMQIKIIGGEVTLNDSEENVDEDTYRITSGDYSGKTFSTLEDLEEFFTELSREHGYEQEDLEEMDIALTRESTISFPDINIDEPECEIVVPSALYEDFGSEYRLAEDVPEMVQVTDAPASIEELSDEQLTKDILKYQDIVRELYKEEDRRRAQREQEQGARIRL